MTKKTYNLYKDGKLVLDSVNVSRIKEFTKRTGLKTSDYADTGLKINGLYTLETAGEDLSERSKLLTEFTEEWEKACKPFRSITWVKKDGRKLNV